MSNKFFNYSENLVRIAEVLREVEHELPPFGVAREPEEGDTVTELS